MTQTDDFNQLYPSPDKLRDHGKLPIPQRLIKECKYDKIKGAQTTYWGYLYPEKFLPYPEVSYAVNAAKKMLMLPIWMIFTTALKWLLLPLLIPPLFKKLVNNFNRYFGGLSQIILSPYILMEDYWCYSVKELRRASNKISQGNPDASQLIDFASMVWEYDDAYRYRLQDFFNEFDKNSFLRQPRKELKRMIKIVTEREQIPSLKSRMKWFYYLFSFALAYRFIRKPIMAFIKEVDIDKLRMDAEDAYFALFCGSYKYHGLDTKERQALRVRIHKANGLKPL